MAIIAGGTNGSDDERGWRWKREEDDEKKKEALLQ